MICIDKPMPKCCDECFALDEHGDYPFCLISQDQSGYTFDVRSRRMPTCPLLWMVGPKWMCHGYWKEQEGYDGDSYYTCSVCGCDWVTVDGTPEENNMRYCPECGAQMDGDLCEVRNDNNNKSGTWKSLGHIIGPMNHPLSEYYECSLCGYQYYSLFDLPPNKCPECGATMNCEQEDING